MRYLMSDRLPCPANAEGVELNYCIESYMEADSHEWRNNPCFGCKKGSDRRNGFAETPIFGAAYPVSVPSGSGTADPAEALEPGQTEQTWETVALWAFNERYGSCLKPEDFPGIAERIRSLGRGPDPVRELYLDDFPTGYPIESIENQLLWAFGSTFGAFLYGYTKDLIATLVDGLKEAETAVSAAQERISTRMLQVVQGRHGTRKAAWDDVVTAVVSGWAAGMAHHFDSPLEEIRNAIHELEEVFRDVQFPPSYRPVGKGRHGPWAKEFFAWNASKILEPIGDADAVEGVALLWIALGWYLPAGKLTEPDAFDNALNNAANEVRSTLTQQRRLAVLH